MNGVVYMYRSYRFAPDSERVNSSRTTKTKNTKMKKVLITFCVLAAGEAFAQTHEQGQIQINVDYELQVGSSLTLEVDGEEADTDDFDVSVAGPRLDLQYGVSDNIGLGIVARLATSEIEDDKASHLDVGISPRYYFLNTDDMNVFGKASVGMSIYNPEEEDGQDDVDNITGLFFGVGGGLNYMFNDMIGANVQVAYGMRNYKDDVEFLPGTTVEQKIGVAGIDAAVGVTIVL